VLPIPRLVVLLGALLSLAAFPAAAQDLDFTADLAADLPGAPGVFALAGTDPGLPQDDLRALRQVIGNAQVVALGEAVHTSGGFYDMKHRIIRHLVERERFRVVAFESPWVRVQQLARYVDTCQGSPEDAVRAGLFGVFASTETAELARWLCQWNRSHPRDRVRVVGFDTQVESNHHFAGLLPFLARIGVRADHPAVANLRTCDGVETTYPRPTPPEVYQSCDEGLRALEELFARDARRITRRTNRQDFGWAQIRLASLRAWSDQSYRFAASRDYGMAFVFNTLRQLAFPRARTVIWAHNFHIGRQSRNIFSYDTMGTHLGQWLGPQYVSIALTAADADIDWLSFGCDTERLAVSPNAVERRLREDLGEPYLLVDLDPPGGGPAYFERGALQFLGGGRAFPNEHFDAFVYLEHSPAMTPLAFASACQ
jgi:erythromycin esterase-like protein